LNSLQDEYAPRSVCFGCGPANERGLQIKSRAEGDTVVCDWTPQPYHHAFENVLNGGITGTLMDCHSNWTAVYAMMKRDQSDTPRPTVTSEFSVKLLRPTPMGQTIHLSARVSELKGDRATVECTLEVDGKPRATFVGTFVAVKEGHPAFARWR
jgi:acyl-coenzyme A thioesterase PaaI-like protein